MPRQAFPSEENVYIFIFLQTEKLDEAHLAIDGIRCNFIFDLFGHDIGLAKKRYTSNQYFDTRFVSLNNTKNEQNSEPKKILKNKFQYLFDFFTLIRDIFNIKYQVSKP